MATALKNMYNDDFFHLLLDQFIQVNSKFDKNTWFKKLYNSEWERMELKQRMRHISTVLHSFLNPNFELGAIELLELFNSFDFNSNESSLGFKFMFFADYVEVYGLNHLDISILAMETITKHSSCEFAVRPFIIKYPHKMMDQMCLWSKHEHAMVRRLSTEGCRPRLPWAMALPKFKKDPTSILSILERLKNDPSESVRRSVANNVNDISKDNPELVYNLVKSWNGLGKDVSWVQKHSCRTLLKQGVPEIMQLFGYSHISTISISDFDVLTKEVEFGNSLHFKFNLQNISNSQSKIRIEYGIYLLKANGSLSKKVFKISEKNLEPGKTIKIERKQVFKKISTRVYYSGQHKVSLIINGVELNTELFLLKGV